MSNQYGQILQASTESLNNIKEDDIFCFDNKLNKVVIKTEDSESMKMAFESFTGKQTKDDDEAEKHHTYYSKTVFKLKEFKDPIATLSQGNGQQGEYTRLILYSDNGVHIRLYIPEYIWIGHPIYQNNICYLLNKLDSKKTLDIYLGNGIGGATPDCTIGNIFSAITNSKANVRIHMNGRGSMIETCLWLHGHKKIISPYGALCLVGVGRLLESFPQWRGYYETIYTKALRLNLITENDLADLLTTNYMIFISSADATAKITKVD